MLMLILVWTLCVLSVLLLVGVAIGGAWLYACGAKQEIPKVELPRWQLTRGRNGKTPARSPDDQLPAV